MIRDSVIFDFYTAKGVHEQEAKRIANAAWRNGWPPAVGFFYEDCYNGQEQANLVEWTSYEK